MGFALLRGADGAEAPGAVPENGSRGRWAATGVPRRWDRPPKGAGPSTAAATALAAACCAATMPVSLAGRPVGHGPGPPLDR